MTSIAEGSRPASLADLAILEALAGAVIEELTSHRGGLVWSRSEARRKPLLEGLRADVEDPRTRVVLGTIDGVAVGYGVLRIEALHDAALIGRVTDLYVLEEARGVGVGDAVLASLIDWAKRRGCVGIDSMALPGDRATKNFFEGHGMVARSITVHHSFDRP